MPHSIIAVTYQLLVPAADFRAHAEVAARQIARTPGLRWKIWGLDPQTGAGTSFYLFDSVEAATEFSQGPVIAALRADLAVGQVTVRVAPVDEDLSHMTHGAAAFDPGQVHQGFAI